jgi:tRNA(Ile)-lysidine synthetase-like protein
MLEEWARQSGIEFRHDASNACLDIQRNRIRHQLLPLLRQNYQPALDKVVPRVMDIVGAEAELVLQMASDWLNCQRPAQGHSRNLSSARARSSSRWFSSAPTFDELPIAIQRQCLQAQIASLGLVAEYDVIEHLRNYPDLPICVGGREAFPLSSPPGTKPGRTANGLSTRTASVLAPKPVAIFRDRCGKVQINAPAAMGFRSDCASVHLTARRGQTVFGGLRLGWRIGVKYSFSTTKSNSGEEVFDADRVGSPVLLRHWQPGDRFQPIGMGNAVKLQDFFTNRKVPTPRRRELVLGLTAAGEVFWVEGQRISERFKLTNATNRALHWRWQRP